MAKNDDIREWYPWHWHRYGTAKRVLDFRLSDDPMAAHGCYRQLLDEMWKCRGKLPTDRRILWHLAGANSLKDYERVADLVEAAFEKTEDGQHFYSELLSAEWDEATRLLEQKREAGRKGGKIRAEALSKHPPKQSLSDTQASTVHNNTNTYPQTPKSENGDKTLLEVTKLHPDSDHYESAERIPPLLANLLIQRLHEDGDKVKQGTAVFRKAHDEKPVDQRKYLGSDYLKAQKFFEQRRYLEYAKDETPKEWAPQDGYKDGRAIIAQLAARRKAAQQTNA